MQTTDAHLQWLFEQSVSGIPVSLDRIQPLYDALQIDRLAPIVIVVGGTNGKGSTIACLTALYRAAGYDEASVTSPHLMQFNERLVINGRCVSDAAIIEAFSVIQGLRDTTTAINAFDFIHLAWFWLIKRSCVDVAIVEVGLGGRLDAVNLLASNVAVITNIALDHQDFLGDTREAIGFEKAHIAREGCPLICGDQIIPKSVYRVCEKIGARVLSISNHSVPGLNLSTGVIKRENVACALMAVDVLQARLPVGQAHIREGLQNVQISGRFEVEMHACQIIYDVAHNPAAAAWVAQQLENTPCQGRTYFVMGLKKTKDAAGVLSAIAHIKGDWYLSSLPEVESVAPEELADYLAALDVKQCYTAQTVRHHLNVLLPKVTALDRIVIFGSFVAVQAAKQYFEEVS